MRKIVFYGAVSLDGYLSDQNDNLDWLFQSDLNGISTYEEFEKNVSTFVMGRTTYQETQKYLKGNELYPGKEKIIFSHHILNHNKDTSFVAGDIIKIFNSLKALDGGLIWIIGGGSIVKVLLENNMLDEIWLQIAPVLLGKGKKLFEPGNYYQKFNLKSVKQMGELTELHLVK
ncbi:dihydrofolate reductase family protein [Weissella koreensis]|uniref:Dihydrofolate reductase n=1 Tax=Weissella koreensis TaxID=165096 RepID=A0A7H1MLJ8_9LACO|nr:dihydrofolate reductase family protein [Weissella koreensis]AVH75130.1 dihydrofolate reductase [Weissella koreensis]EJF33541.1 hypothetical protein JC2156_09030 [Weissella koreensis KCTC 3621]QGN20356.1 dihydrofolate reductase [Weissella koreensis]QNT64334.1 dihydrofolate reductase [Weissella koreensis]